MKNNLLQFHLYYTIALLLAIVLSSCGSSSTKVIGTWVDKSAKPYNNIFLSAITQNLQARNKVEGELSKGLKKPGVTITKSITMFPPNFDLSNEENRKIAIAQIQEKGFDGIITVSLVKEEEETRYHQGTTQYAPTTNYGYYGTFGGYYNYGYSIYSTPSYYTKSKVYFIETNLYDAQSLKLVWSAQSESFSPKDLNSFAKQYAYGITAELQKAKLIKGEK